jgi:DNA-directed RNA polymerase
MLTFDEQFQRETAADESAAVEVLKQYIEAAESGNIDGLPRAKIILGRLFADIKDGIEFEQNKPTKGPAGALRRWLKDIDSSVAAVITLRYVLRFLLGNNPKMATPQVLMRGIGRGFELEVMINKAYKVNPVYVDRELSNLKTSRTVSQNHIQRTMAQVYTNVLQLSDADGLSATDAMRLGKFGLNACLVCGMIVIHRTTNRKGSHVYYDLIPDIREFLNPQNYNTNLITAADQLSMLAPPRPWVDSGVGGYYSPRRQAMFPLRDTTAGTLRKSARKDYRKELHPDKIPVIYSVVNYLQAQPFEVKSDIYDLIMRVWKDGGGVLGIPTPNMSDKPEFPFPDTWSKHTATPLELDVFQQWKLEAVAHYGKVAKHMSHVRECTTFLKIARELQGSEVYHPVYLDFRGRLYYRGTPNPQGADLARAVLHFHNKKALGKRGVFWLKVHIANSLGYDKVSPQERAEYVDTIWNRLAFDLSACFG